MNTLSNLPPGVTNYDIEEAAGAFDGEPEETKEEKIARLEAAGIIVRDCPGCRYWYEHPTADPFAPSHRAMDSCRSGRRNHCTCSTCF